MLVQPDGSCVDLLWLSHRPRLCQLRTAKCRGPFNWVILFSIHQISNSLLLNRPRNPRHDNTLSYSETKISSSSESNSTMPMQSTVPVGRETSNDSESGHGAPLYLKFEFFNTNTGVEQQMHSSNGPPTTFLDILPPELITTSTRSEAGYMGYRGKSTFKTPFRRSTEPAATSISRANLDSRTPVRSSTIRKMKTAMSSIRRTMTRTSESSKGAKRPSLPTSSGFTFSNSSRFGTGRWTSRGDDIQRQEYQNLSD